MIGSGTTGTRELTIIREFNPYGLSAEALDGCKPSDDDHHYYLFDPQATKQIDDAEELEEASALTNDGSDHELFIRGNRWIFNFLIFILFWNPGLDFLFMFTGHVFLGWILIQKENFKFMVLIVVLNCPHWFHE